MPQQEIWTIGHSTHAFEKFVEMLNAFEIEMLVDVRHYPGSRRFPHFNKENLAVSMPKNHIAYNHLIDLGGRRKPKPDSQNNAWRLPSFMGYADYMETENFKKAATELETFATQKKVAYMCAEAVWWSCHRSLISDYLKVKNWKVTHIMGVGTGKEHPYTSPAQIIDGKLNYQKK